MEGHIFLIGWSGRSERTFIVPTGSRATNRLKCGSQLCHPGVAGATGLKLLNFAVLQFASFGKWSSDTKLAVLL